MAESDRDSSTPNAVAKITVPETINQYLEDPRPARGDAPVIDLDQRDAEKQPVKERKEGWFPIKWTFLGE